MYSTRRSFTGSVEDQGMDSGSHEKPATDDKNPLRTWDVLWCHVPTTEDGHIVPGYRKTPVFIVGAKLNDDKSIASLTCMYTRLARPYEEGDAEHLLIDNERQLEAMGCGDQERVICLTRMVDVPFQQRFIGETPEITGSVPDHLRGLIKRQTQQAQRSALRRQGNFATCPIMTRW